VPAAWIGNALCRELLRGAERAGVSKAMANIVHSNHAMLLLLQSLEWPLLHVNRGPSLEVTIQLQSPLMSRRRGITASN
jgi:hypothetical protein